MCDPNNKLVERNQAMPLNQEINQQQEANQQGEGMLVQNPVQLAMGEQDQMEQQRQQLGDPMQANLAQLEVPAPDQVAGQQQEVDLNTYDILETKEELVAQMASEVSLNSLHIVGRASKKLLKTKRKEFRSKFDEKNKTRKAILLDELEAQKSAEEMTKTQLEQYRDEVKRKRDELREIKTEERTVEQLNELNRLEEEYDTLSEHKKVQEKRMKTREGMIGLQDQSIKLRKLVADFREKCEGEVYKGNSTLMNNMIEQARAFDELINSNEFDIAKEHSYISQFVKLRNAVATYYNKNKGTKIFRTGRRRRNMADAFLKSLTGWISDLPMEIQDTFIEEMEKPENETVRMFKCSEDMYQELGEKAFKKEAVKNGQPKLKAKDYVTPLTIRMMTAAKYKKIAATNSESLDLSAKEKREIKEKGLTKNPEVTYQDERCFPYMFGRIKRNFDGTVVDPEQEKMVKEAIHAWRYNDIEKMEPFYDNLIEQILSYNVTLEDFLPENIMKNGPENYKKQQLIHEIENIFFDKNALGAVYMKKKSPALATKLKMISALYPYTSSLTGLCDQMNIDAGQKNINTAGEITEIKTWKKKFDLKKAEPTIKEWIEHPEETQKYYFQFELEDYIDQNEKKNQHYPMTREKFIEKFDIPENMISENTSKVVAEDAPFFFFTGVTAAEFAQKGTNYYSKKNEKYRRIQLSKEFVSHIPITAENEETVFDLYETIIKKEDEIGKLEGDKKEQAIEELKELHKQKEYLFELHRRIEEKQENLDQNLENCENDYLLQFFKYEGRNPELAEKYKNKLAGTVNIPQFAELTGNLNHTLALIRKLDIEEAFRKNTIPEEKKAAYEKLLNIRSKEVEIGKESIRISIELSNEHTTIGKYIGDLYQSQKAEGIPVDKCANYSNTYLGKRYAQKAPVMAKKVVEKEKEQAHLEMQARNILWKEVYQFTGCMNDNGQLMSKEKSEKILDLVNEFIHGKDVYDRILVQKKSYSTGIEGRDINDALNLKSTVEYMNQELKQLEDRFALLKKQILEAGGDDLKGLEDASPVEVVSILKTRLNLSSDGEAKTLRDLDKDQFIKEEMYAKRAQCTTHIVKPEGAELAYKVKSTFMHPADLYERYVTLGSKEDIKLREKFKSEDLDRIVRAGLHYIRFDKNGNMYKEDIPKDEWNKKWIAACVSDSYEDKEALLQDMMDEMEEFAKKTYKERVDIDAQFSDDDHMQTHFRQRRLELTFTGNILKNEHFMAFKKNYVEGTPEMQKKWKAFERNHNINSKVGVYLTTQVQVKYGLDSSMNNPISVNKEITTSLNGMIEMMKEPIYRKEVYKHAENKDFEADIVDVYTRMAEIKNFKLDEVEKYDELFKIYAKVDDMDARIKNLPDGSMEKETLEGLKKELLASKDKVLKKINPSEQ